MTETDQEESGSATMPANAPLDDFIGAYGEAFAYSFDNNILLNWYPERIKSCCPVGAHSLELGVGHGFTTNRFATHFARHVVLDGSPSVIAQFQENFPECTAEVVHSYFETYETNERFDIVIMGFVLEHVSDPRLILERYRRFLVPGGRLFVAVPNGESLHRRFGHAAGLLDNCMSLGAGDRALGHMRQYSVATLNQDLEATGYRVLRREGVFLKTLTTAQLQSLQLSESIIRGMCLVGIDYPELSCGLLFEAEVLAE